MGQESDQPRLTKRLRCCVCGDDTADASDYVQITLTAEPSAAQQVLGAHAEHLNQILAPGFSVEVHLM
ncbi:hypothetical protein E1298_02180 [Actinomadura rubrisoli]|uniref:Uncharacterized protein n=2 Tax=Actinomadura rubrisoli TaxID=2530368 RepID=A0A4R5CAC6_9ACTN|nr:hypothetical protein E1298_02180 [Actinomadura rubrisoli]